MVENSRYRQKRRTPITAREFENLVEKVEANSEAFRIDQLTQTSLVTILFYGGLRIGEVVGDSGRRWKIMSEKAKLLANTTGLPEDWKTTRDLYVHRLRGELTGILKEDVSLEGDTLFITSDPLKHGKREEPLELSMAWPRVVDIGRQWYAAQAGRRVWPISQTSARSILSKAMVNLYPHAFRASLASNMARDPDMSVSDLMGWFGWARSSTADAYIMAQRSRVKAKKSIEKLVNT